MIGQVVKKFLKGSFPCVQEPAIGPCLARWIQCTPHT